VTPEDWQDFSHKNIDKAERERQSSVALRSLVDGILQQTSNDMRKQCSEVNVAFNKRIAETKDTKSKLEDHLNKVRNSPGPFQGFLGKRHLPKLGIFHAVYTSF
jgi:tektin-1